MSDEKFYAPSDQILDATALQPS